MILSRFAMQQEERRIRRHRMGDPRMGDYRLYAGEDDSSMVPAVIAGEMASIGDTSPGIKWNAVATGVATGVSVWLLTRLLDRMFKISK